MLGFLWYGKCIHSLRKKMFVFKVFILSQNHGLCYNDFRTKTSTNILIIRSQ